MGDQLDEVKVCSLFFHICCRLAKRPGNEVNKSVPFLSGGLE